MTAKQRNGKPKPGGRELTLTDEKHKTIVDTVAAGCAMETAAAYAGVNSWTFKDWLRLGRDGLKLGRDNRYTRLVADIEQARAGAEAGRVARVAAAGIDGKWEADAWWLERTYPDRYGRRTRVEGTIAVQAVPMIVWEQLSVDEAETLVALLRKGAPAADDPALSASARPALELVAGPGEVVELTDEPAPG